MTPSCATAATPAYPPARMRWKPAIGRLRTGLGEYAWLVATVTKRGYRLAVDR